MSFGRAIEKHIPIPGSSSPQAKYFEYTWKSWVERSKNEFLASPFERFEIETFLPIFPYPNVETAIAGFELYKENVKNIHKLTSYSSSELESFSCLDAYTIYNDLSGIGEVMERGWAIILKNHVPNNKLRRKNGTFLPLSEFIDFPMEEKLKLSQMYPMIKDFIEYFPVSFYPQLRTAVNILELILHNRFINNPIQLRTLVQEIMADPEKKYTIVDKAMDRLLGIYEDESESKVFADPQSKYGKEQIGYGGASYSVVASVLKNLSPSESDIFYDLGSGYGRVLLLGAILYPNIQFLGVELVGTRAETTRQVAKQFGLTNIKVNIGDVRDADFSQGSIFFLYNPFEKGTLEEVGKKLCIAGQKRDFSIIALSDYNDYFASQDWLQNVMLSQLGVNTPYFIYKGKLQIFKNVSKI